MRKYFVYVVLLNEYVFVIHKITIVVSDRTSLMGSYRPLLFENLLKVMQCIVMFCFLETGHTEYTFVSGDKTVSVKYTV